MAGALLLLASCGNNALPFNQTPVINLIIPSNITAGSEGFTLFVSGTGFMGGPSGVSFAYWNGSPRSTYFNPTTGELTVAIPASDVASPGQAQVTVVNPAPGGGPSQASFTFTIVPVQASYPVISSLSPSSAPYGNGTTKITITGSNFVVSDVVTWNGGDRASSTTYLDQNHVELQTSPGDLATPGTASISVSDPGLVNASPSVNFIITGPSNPVPALNGFAPSKVTAGSSDLQLLVNGSGFVPTSTVLWNGAGNPLATSYLSSSQIIALIPAADLAAAGTAAISVSNPAPGVGTSTSITFTITP